MGDRKLLHKLHTNPEQGMTLLMKQYAGLVYAVVRSKLRPDTFSQGEIEACVADTFSEFYCDLDKYVPDKGSLKSWLCTIAKHNALDYLRKHTKDAALKSLEELPGELPADFSLEIDADRQDQREISSTAKHLDTKRFLRCKPRQYRFLLEELIHQPHNKHNEDHHGKHVGHIRAHPIAQFQTFSRVGFLLEILPTPAFLAHAEQQVHQGAQG